MHTAAGWAVFGVVGACAVSVGGLDLVVGSAAPPASLAVVADGPPPADVAQHIKDLGADDYRVREKAGKALEAKGEKALPHLRRALGGADSPEVARRLTVLVRKMDHDRLVSPKRVTLTAKNKTAKEVLDEIAKQTGYGINFQAGGPTADGRHSFEFENTPFWQAVDAVADAAGLGVYSNYDDDAIQINSYSGQWNPYTAYAGPFRMVASNINSNRSIQLSGLDRRGIGPRPTESININFSVWSEPKNPILGITNHQTEVVAAVDDTGTSMVPPRNPNEYAYRSGYYNSGYRQYNVSSNLYLIRGNRDATRIKSVKGKMGIILLAGIVPEVVIPDPVKTKTKKFVGRTVEVDYDSTAEANGQYTVSLTIKRLGVQDPNNIDYNWTNNLWQKIELLDEKGNKYRTYGANSMNNNGMSVQMSIPFQSTDRRGQQQKFGPPVKLVVNEWLQVTHEVTFEFRDVPLP